MPSNEKGRCGARVNVNEKVECKSEACPATPSCFPPLPSHGKQTLADINQYRPRQRRRLLPPHFSLRRNAQ